MIIASAPTRVSLFGGGTDVEPFVSQYGGGVLSFAISIYHRVTLEEAKKNYIFAMGKEMTGERKYDLIRKILSYYDGKKIKLIDEFDGFQSAGLGSSACASVALIGALNRLYKVNMDKDEIAWKAYQTEIDLGWHSGMQDQFASAIGGMNVFSFSKTISHVNIPKYISESLYPYLLLCRTNKIRISSKIQDQLVKRIKAGQNIKELLEMKSYVVKGSELLTAGRFQELGQLLDISFYLKKQSNPSCTNSHIDNIYETAMEYGAWGGKILGAGGEGHIIFIAPPRIHDTIIKKTKLKKVDFQIDYNGLMVREV